jgi:hypothetical protein
MNKSQRTPIHSITEVWGKGQTARSDIPICDVVARLPEDRDVKESEGSIEPFLVEKEPPRFIFATILK